MTPLDLDDEDGGISTEVGYLPVRTLSPGRPQRGQPIGKKRSTAEQRPMAAQKDTETQNIAGQPAPTASRTAAPDMQALAQRDLAEHRRVGARLQASEQRFRALFEWATIGIATMDTAGRYLETNPALQQMLACSAEELQGQNFIQFTHPEDQATVKQLFADLVAGRCEHCQTEQRLIRRDSGSVWANLVISLVRDQDGTPQFAFSIVEEISRRKQTEEALQRYAERLKTLHEIDQAILAARSPGTIALAALGRLRQLVPCQRIIVAELNRPGMARVLAVEADSKFETDFGARLELFSAEFFNRQRLKGADDLAALTQRSPFQESLYAEGIRAYMIAPLLVQEELLGALILEADRPNIFTAEHVDTAAEVAALLAVAIRQAHLYDAVRQRAEELAEANRRAQEARAAAEAANQAKSVFLANMSHELRTPLNAILGFAQLMTHSPSLTTEQQTNLAIIGRSGEHLLSLINDILELSKIEAGRITVLSQIFDLYQLLDGLEEMFRLRAADKGLALIFERAPEVPRWIKTDEGKLRQVLINLLGNAVKFTTIGGIILRVSMPPMAGTAPTEPGYLHFEVQDTGPGIAPDEIPLVFEPFVQTESGRQSQQGTGLGLPISRKFVQLLGGELTLESKVGQGAIFRFNVATETVTAREVPRSPLPHRVVGLEPGQPTYRLLVVEDQEASRLLLIKLLTPLGFEVRGAENGAQAFALWQEWRPHLIWMDMRMPDMNGYEATRRIKAAPGGEDTVIIALTATAFESDRSRILAEGCNDFVRKPFREAEIYNVLTQHLGVRFIYDLAQAEEPAIPAHVRVSKELNPAALARSAPAWLAQLKQATIDADRDLILALIDQIRPHDPALAEGLVALANNFDHDQILSLIKQAGG